MKRIFYLSATILFLNACSNNKPETDANTNTAAAEETPLQKTMAHFKSNNTFPFVVDTAFLNKLNSMMQPVNGFDSLGTAEVKVLDAKWHTTEANNVSYYDYREFYKIDSIKASGTYKAWCEKLDIGQTKCSNAYAIQKMQLDSNTVLLVWAFTNSSYEACPYFTNQTINFTIVYKGSVSQTYYLGEYSSYGDPPVSSEITANGKLNADGSFSIDWHQVSDEDMDQPFIFVTDNHSEFIIKHGEIMKLKEDKKENVKTERPKAKES